jgi:hypothetical protein
MIHESVNYCDMHNKLLQFQYSNGKHGVRLIKLPMSKGNDGRVIPNIKKGLTKCSLLYRRMSEMMQMILL